MTDILPRILLSVPAALRWGAVFRETAAAAHAAGLHLDRAPDEEAELINPDTVRIHVTRPDGQVLAEMTLTRQAGDWRWMDA